MAANLLLFDLPIEMLYQILEYCSYSEVAGLRLVCRQFDELCKNVLNSGFNKAIKLHKACQKFIKTQLPRRESERRNHPLSHHVEILSSMETRISILSMTYGKYMDLNLCCFIPGKVIDELFHILNIVLTTNGPLTPNNLLQELRDISSMAIEHFDERVAITFKKYCENANGFCPFNDNSYISSENNKYPFSPMKSLQNIYSPSCIHSGGLRNLAFSTITTQVPGGLRGLTDTSHDIAISSKTPILSRISYPSVDRNTNYLNCSSSVALGSNEINYKDMNGISSSTGLQRFSAHFSRKNIPSSAYCTNFQTCRKHKSFIQGYKKLKSEHNRALRKIKHLQYAYVRQVKRIRQLFNIADEAKVQVTELKKRVDFFINIHGLPADGAIEEDVNEPELPEEH